MTKLPKDKFVTINSLDNIDRASNYTKLFVSLSGSVLNVINGIEIFASPGDIYVVTADMEHELKENNNYKYSFFNFDFPTLVRKSLAILNTSGFQQLFVSDVSLRKNGIFVPNLYIDTNELQVVEQLTMLLEQIDKDENVESSVLCKHTFLALVSLLCLRCKRRSDSDKNKNIPKIMEIASYIMHNYTEKLTLDSLCEMSYYSRRHFTRLFRECYNMSPIDFLNQIRIQKAEELLASTALSVTEIAFKCGFSDSIFFCRRFKQCNGVTPLYFRKHFQTDDENTALLHHTSIIR